MRWRGWWSDRGQLLEPGAVIGDGVKNARSRSACDERRSMTAYKAAEIAY
jgi:hypothetical protein